MRNLVWGNSFIRAVKRANRRYDLRIIFDFVKTQEQALLKGCLAEDR